MHTKVLVNTENNRLRDQDGKLIATVWTREIDECRKDGESWLDMRERTEPQRAAAEAESASNATLFATAPELLALLIESQESIGGDWRERRDAAIAKATGTK